MSQHCFHQLFFKLGNPTFLSRFCSLDFNIHNESEHYGAGFGFCKLDTLEGHLGEGTSVEKMRPTCWTLGKSMKEVSSLMIEI